MGSNLLRVTIVAALGLSYQAQAYDCIGLEVWDSNTVYTSGDLVQTSNHAYQASHWTQGNDPVRNSGDWQTWQDLGQCDTGSGNTAPAVSIVSPVNNAEVPEGTATTIQASASDSDGSIAHVIFLVDGQNIATVSQAPYQADWTAIAGATTISVIATDNESATSETQIAISVTLAGEPIPPSVTLTSPSGSEQLTEGDLLTLSANASDTDGSVDKVEFFVDGQLIASDTSAPYEVTWTSVSGTHNIKAKATDNGNQTTSTQEVSMVVASKAAGGCAGLPTYTAGSNYSTGQLVQNHNQKYRCDIAGWCSSNAAWAYEPGQGDYWEQAWTGLGACAAPPAVTITHPSDNQILLAGTTVSFSADASDSDGTINQVEFFAGNNSLGVVTQPPYSVSWTATQIGLNSLKAVATDNENNTGEAMVSVTVSDQDLVVALTSPAPGQTVGLGKSVQFAADATSLSASVKQVDFLVNGATVGTDTTAPYSFNWTAGAVGRYTVAAKAIDSTNSEVTSDAATISVEEQTEKTHKLIGYWHNFVNGAGCPMRLADMSQAWDVIDIAFAENDRTSDGTVHFNLYSGDIHSSCAALDPAQFKQDMAALQAKGKKFVLSLGGAEGTITLNTDQD